MAENETLFLTWHDAVWTGVLNSNNVLDYFMQRSNPFFDHTCNNEQIRMQRLSNDNLTRMTGIEYTFLHGSEPNLFVIRKQRRISPDSTQALADYYILNGVVYAAPDLRSLLSSRLASVAAYTHDALRATIDTVAFAPSTGYRWMQPDGTDQTAAERKSNRAESARDSDSVTNRSERPSSTAFQRHRVDPLLREFAAQFGYVNAVANGNEPKREADEAPSRSGASAAQPTQRPAATAAAQNGAQQQRNAPPIGATSDMSKSKEKRPRTAPKI